MKTKENIDTELELQGDQRQPVMPTHDGLTITTEIAQASFRRVINLEGLTVAQLMHKQLCYLFSELKEWSGIAQAINKLLEQEAERKRKLLSLLNKKPANIFYGPYYEIQAGGNCYTNQRMEGLVNEDEEASNMGMQIKKALDVLLEEKLMKNLYDYTWVMEAMNQTKDMPSFITPSSFINYMKDLGVKNLPSEDTILLKQNKFVGKFPNWEFTDCDSTEAQRRINVGKRFLSAYRGQ